MAAANILTTASTAASSSDTAFTVDTLVSLKGVSGDAYVAIECKDDGGAYNQVGTLQALKEVVELCVGYASDAAWRYERQGRHSLQALHQRNRERALGALSVVEQLSESPVIGRCDHCGQHRVLAVSTPDFRWCRVCQKIALRPPVAPKT